VSAQGILVRAVVSYPHDDFSKHVASVCTTFFDHGSKEDIDGRWAKDMAYHREKAVLDINTCLEFATPAALRNLLLEGVLHYSDVAQATLAAANVMSTAKLSALAEIETSYQSCYNMIREIRLGDKCKCPTEASSNHRENEEFLEFCCETNRNISARKEHLHITFRTISRVVEQTPGWETRRDALRALDKLYWECIFKDVLRRDGTDDVKDHLIDVMGGIVEGMTLLERQRYCEEGFNFKTLEEFEVDVYQALKARKQEADKRKQSLPMTGKDPATSRDTRTPMPQSEGMTERKNHMSEEARIQKAETKRLKKRRAKDRKALQKALANLDLGDIN
jgi:hypothetical protein